MSEKSTQLLVLSPLYGVGVEGKNISFVSCLDQYLNFDNYNITLSELVPSLSFNNANVILTYFF